MKKKCLSEPRFELGNSDPIANHITSSPRSIYWNWAKNFATFLISYMIYLYGLIQPMGGRNRVKLPILRMRFSDSTQFKNHNFEYAIWLFVLFWFSGLVISGSYDETLKLWCLKTGRCEATLRGHRGRVLCMHVPWAAHPGIFLSGSDDKSIKGC